MQRITTESSIEEVMKDIGVGPGEDLRESSKRRRNLEKFAQLRSRNPQTTLTLDEVRTAFVRADEDGDKEFKDIVVTTEKIPQEKFNLPGDYHDFLVQKGMTIHEVGHILYSSYPEMEKHIEEVEENREDDGEVYAKMFKDIYNVMEDGAIERFLSSQYRVEEELVHIRTCLHENKYMGQKIERDEEGVEYHYPFFHAVMTALLNIGVYDNGELEKLLDEDNDTHKFAIRGADTDRQLFVELLPDLREYTQKAQEETDAAKRSELIYELWTLIEKHLDKSTTPGTRRVEKKMQGEDGESYHPRVPQNLGESHGEEEGDARVPGGEEPLGDKRDEVDEMQGDMEEKGERGIQQEIKQEGGDWSDELEEIMNALGAGDGVDEIFIPEDGDIDVERRNEAERYGKRCAKLLRTRLRRKRRDRTIRGKKHGQFDSNRLIPASRGSTRVFKQTKEGDTRDYSCVIVCDRSGSMGSRIEEVELAAGAVAYGLQEIGVDTCLMDTFSSKTTLAKPFQTDIEEFEEKLFAARCGGGTPLRYTLNFARNRMERGHGKVPFMIVLTDGKPSSREETKAEIKNANFPVIGLYLNGNESAVEEQLKLYDRAMAVGEDDDIAGKLIDLLSAIMF